MKSEPAKRTLDIGEVAHYTGLPTSAIRYYEEKGLIKSTGRHGLRRLFNSHVLQQLEFISLGRHAGLTLDDIGSMFSVEGKLQVNRAFLLDKAADMERNIRRLNGVRDTLLHVAKCSASNHMECPKFQKLLRLAGKKNRARVKSKGSKKAHPNS
jgi:DNA-binding transcriptional MerR regulator